MRLITIVGCLVVALLASCSTDTDKTGKTNQDAAITRKDSTQIISSADAATILARREVPILCYHNIRNFHPGESDHMKGYTVTPAAFAEQMKALYDSGYHTIQPDELLAYLTSGKQLPSNPVMISFDDTHLEHYSIGAAEMNKYGFKGLYFIMTISINRPHYMSADQLKALADSGHTIASHTWDHHMVTQYHGGAWDSQLVAPKIRLEGISGKHIRYFAYPFGLWNKAAIPEIKKRGYDMAFILSDKRDSVDPLYTVRRMIVPGTWSTPGMMKAMITTFHLQ